MKNPPVPTLSTFGWVTNVAEKIDFLLAHCVHSDAEQDPIYESSVFSMQSLVQKYSDDPNAMANAIVSKMKQYLSRYYPEGVEVSANITPAKDQPVPHKDRVNIAFTIVITQEGKTYSVPHLLKTVDSKFVAFARDNNG